MKIQAEVTIATGQYENIKPVIEIEVPDGLEGVKLYWHLYDMFHNIERPSHKTTNIEPKNKWQKLNARKEGQDFDNDPYLDGDEDEGSKQDNLKAYEEAHK